MAQLYRRAFSSVVVVALIGAVLLMVSFPRFPLFRSNFQVHRPVYSTAELGGLVVRSPRVVVIKKSRLLYLYDGEDLVRTYRINIGQHAQGGKVRDGDMRTPIGRFHIVTSNPDSPYHRFLGIDYPNERAVVSGLSLGLITEGEAEALRTALAEGRCPDWSTALGGGIGLHGGRIGPGSTAGCVAVSDSDIETLYHVLRLGDPVEIWP